MLLVEAPGGTHWQWDACHQLQPAAPLSTYPFATAAVHKLLSLKLLPSLVPTDSQKHNPTNTAYSSALIKKCISGHLWDLVMPLSSAGTPASESSVRPMMRRELRAPPKGNVSPGMQSPVVAGTLIPSSSDEYHLFILSFNNCSLSVSHGRPC